MAFVFIWSVDRAIKELIMHGSSLCRHILAVGLESGEIMVYTCRLNPPEWSLTIAVDPVYLSISLPLSVWCVCVRVRVCVCVCLACS